MKATLFIFSGLPASGKTTLSRLLAKSKGAVYLRIDTIEQALREFSFDVQEEGYSICYRIALDNLRLGLSVVADSCNPIELTRRAWERVAGEANADFVNIEVICSDKSEHKKRAEARTADIKGHKLPTWEDIENRDYHKWHQERTAIDTAGRTEGECFETLLRVINAR
ncbi:MAG TPA: AAA family ATPase [Verrucomicrobiae bacterium]